jgi:hypothetical protein
MDIVVETIHGQMQILLLWKSCSCKNTKLKEPGCSLLNEPHSRANFSQQSGFCTDKYKHHLHLSMEMVFILVGAEAKQFVRWIQ